MPLRSAKVYADARPRAGSLTLASLVGDGTPWSPRSGC